jgi:hypothetical protein
MRQRLLGGCGQCVGDRDELRAGSIDGHAVVPEAGVVSVALMPGEHKFQRVP